MNFRYSVDATNKFKKDIKRIKKRGYDMALLKNVINKLAMGEPLPAANKDHALTGNMIGYRECHIQPDWLLLYILDDDCLVLTLTRTGTHSDLF